MYILFLNYQEIEKRGIINKQSCLGLRRTMYQSSHCREHAQQLDKVCDNLSGESGRLEFMTGLSTRRFS